jgi:hypothetical protein
MKRYRGYWLGKHRSKATRKKISKKITRLWQSPEYRAKNKTTWRGNKVKYRALHGWLKRNKPKSRYNLCEFCGKRKNKFGNTKLDIANIKNHTYTRKFEDYKWFHRGCHRKFDFPNGWGNSKSTKIKQKDL